MDYFELLEQNTDDAKIQFQLYKACLNGAGEGASEAQEWLERAAENGHPEAVELLDLASKSDNRSTDKDYSNMSLLELTDLAKEDYYAAKALYSKMRGDISQVDAIKYLELICSFEESNTEDFEVLAYNKFLAYTKRLNISAEEVRAACENAIELGSQKAKRLLLNLYTSNPYTLSLAKDIENDVFKLSDDIARSGDFKDKFYHYCMLFSEEYSTVKANTSILKKAWKEELINSSELSNYPHIKSFLEGNDGYQLNNLLFIMSGQSDFESSPEFLPSILAIAVFIHQADSFPNNILNIEDPYFQYGNYARMKMQNALEKYKKTIEEEEHQKSLEEENERRIEQEKSEENSHNPCINNNAYIPPQYSWQPSTTINSKNKKSVIQKYFELLKTNNITRIISLALVGFVFLLCVSGGIKHSVNKNRIDLTKYFVSSNLVLEGYEQHGTIISSAYDLLDWEGLYASSTQEISVEDFKNLFKCEFDGSTENLSNGDKVSLKVTWNKNEVNNIFGKKIMQKGEVEFTFKINNLSSKPSFNLFKYVNVQFEGTDGKVKIKISSMTTDENLYGYNIKDSVSGKDNVAAFNIYRNDVHIDTYFVYLNTETIGTFKIGDEVFYSVQGAQKVTLNCVSQKGNNEIACVESSLFEVKGLDTLVTSKDMIRKDDVNKFIKLSKTYVTDYAYDGTYFISDSITDDYKTAIVALYHYTSFNIRYDAFIIMYDPAINEDGNITSYSYEYIVFSKNILPVNENYDISKTLTDNFKCTSDVNKGKLD